MIDIKVFSLKKLNKFHCSQILPNTPLKSFRFVCKMLSPSIHHVEGGMDFFIFINSSVEEMFGLPSRFISLKLKWLSI